MRRTSWRAAVAALGCAALLGAAAPAAQAQGRTDPGRPAPAGQDVRARVWVTTPDRAELLHERPSVAFARGASDLTTIEVDPDRTYQVMDGFGASITDSSAALLAAMPPDQRRAAMRALFDPQDGIGVSFLRQPLGSSDFTAASEHWTYDDVPAGQTDLALSRFSIAHDERQVLPLLREAKRLNPRLTVLATPWSPPAWMKTGDSLVGGQLKDDPRIVDAYARYLVKAVQAYARAGVPIDYLTVQNEPQHRSPDGYPGTDMPVAQQVAVIEALGPKLRAASPRTRILGYDHNWQTHPNDVEGTDPASAEYPQSLLRSGAARWLAGTAFHCYYGDPSAQSALHEQFPGKGIWFTECSGSHGPDDTAEQIFRGTLTWHARTLAIGTTRNWARSVVNWNIALREDGGPHLGGCGTCTGLLTVLPDGSVRPDAEYYTIGHLAKFVQPGARRIGSTSFGTTGWNGQVMDVAFRNPDGSTALVVHNENDAPRSFAVAVGDRSFEYTLPGGALATFVWPPSRLLTDPRTPLDLRRATATATGGEGAGLAVDGDASTRWSSGAAQAPGTALTVDLGRTTAFREVAVDAGDNLGDFPRGWSLAVSRDGDRWRTVATGAGTGQLLTVRLAPTAARYLRVTTTAPASSWWSVADLRLYR